MVLLLIAAKSMVLVQRVEYELQPLQCQQSESNKMIDQDVISLVCQSFAIAADVKITFTQMI